MKLSILLVCIVVLFNLGLGLAVISRDIRQPQNRSFFLLAYLSAFWTLLNFFGGKVNNETISTWLVHGDFAVGVFLAGSFWYFGRVAWDNVRNTPSKASHLLLHMGVLALCAIATFIPYVVHVSDHGGTVIIEEGSWYWLYAISILYYPIAGSVYLLRARHKARGRPKTQLNIILASLVVAAIIVITPNLLLPLFISDNVLLQDIQSAAYVGFIIFLGAATYTIIRHRLFNIRLLIARSVAYALIIGSLGLLYSIALFAFTEVLFKNQVVGQSQNGIFIGLALVSAITFQPIKLFFDRLTDKIFFQGHYDTQQVLNSFSSILVAEKRMDSLLDQCLHLLHQVIQSSYSVVVITTRISTHSDYSIGNVPFSIQDEHFLQTLSKTKVLITDELNNQNRQNQLSAHDIAISLPLRNQNKFLGYLLFGSKQDGGIYSDQDIHLLEIATKELAIAIENASAYEQIEQFNVTLQERVEEATRELRVKNRKLHELDHAKDEFISMASHQLRTPLTTVKGYLSMMLDGDTGKVSAAQRKVLDMAYFSSERMVSLISDMLNVSRISTGKFTIQAAPVNLLDIVKSEVQQLERTAVSHRVRLVTKLPKDFPTVLLDEGKIRQVMMNFIDNAIYYTPEGGEVRVELEATSQAIEFRVVDTGIGVPEAVRTKLFTKFFRADNARQQRPDGTGLGLFMAKKVVTAQGGSIIFSSRMGKGSTFGFRFALSLITP